MTEFFAGKPKAEVLEQAREMEMEMEQEQSCFTYPAFSLAIAYVPEQRWECLYEPDVALNRGTLFRSLDLPFIGEEALPRG